MLDSQEKTHIRTRVRKKKNRNERGETNKRTQLPGTVSMVSIKNRSTAFDNYPMFHHVDTLAIIPIGRHSLNLNHQPILYLITNNNEERRKKTCKKSCIKQGH